jgi:ditrans,polycis-polyprenyl diphosphate synthase
MDGNRRYAQKYGMMTSKGHSEGYSALLDCLQWCQELGVSFVSVYAFSIDNYKRTAEEVDTLMILAEEKLIELSREEEKLGEKGICVKVLGDLSLAPRAVRAAAERVMQATEKNSSCTLNICFSYTACREMEQALERSGDSNSKDGTIGDHFHHMDEFLYTTGCPPVDILIRTSGERRLSDFMMRQCGSSLLHFTPVLWPDFSYFDLLEAIFRYQTEYKILNEVRENLETAKMQAILFQQHQLSHYLRQNKISAGIVKEVHSPNSIVTPEDASSEDSMDESECHLKIS